MKKQHGYDVTAENKQQKSVSREPALPFNFEHDVQRNTFECNHCSRLFLSAYERDRHEEIHFQNKPYSCRHCGTNFRKHTHKKMQEKGCGVVAAGAGITRRHNTYDDDDDDDEFMLQKSTLRRVAKNV